MVSCRFSLKPIHWNAIKCSYFRPCTSQAPRKWPSLVAWKLDPRRSFLWGKPMVNPGCPKPTVWAGDTTHGKVIFMDILGMRFMALGLSHYAMFENIELLLWRLFAWHLRKSCMIMTYDFLVAKLSAHLWSHSAPWKNPTLQQLDPATIAMNPHGSLYGTWGSQRDWRCKW